MLDHKVTATFRNLLDNTSPSELDLEYDNLCMLGIEEPTTLDETKKEAFWQRAMDEEMSSITDLIMVDPPAD